MNHLIKEELMQIKQFIEQHKISSKEFFSLTEAADYLKVSKSFLYKLTSSTAKPIKFYKPGKHIYFKKADLDLYITHSNK